MTSLWNFVVEKRKVFKMWERGQPLSQNCCSQISEPDHQYQNMGCSLRTCLISSNFNSFPVIILYFDHCIEPCLLLLVNWRSVGIFRVRGPGWFTSADQPVSDLVQLSTKPPRIFWQGADMAGRAFRYRPKHPSIVFYKKNNTWLAGQRRCLYWEIAAQSEEPREQHLHEGRGQGLHGPDDERDRVHGEVWSESGHVYQGNQRLPDLLQQLSSSIREESSLQRVWWTAHRSQS